MRENVMCFVRNLPYDCDDETLETTFSERFGPVKESWVVRERDRRALVRGFGYVKFAIPEDARDACGMSGKIEIGKRMVAVVMAKRKAPVERSSETPRETARTRREREERRGGETTETEGRGGEEERESREEECGWWSARARRGRANGGDRGIETRGEIEGVDADAVKALAREAGS